MKISNFNNGTAASFLGHNLDKSTALFDTSFICIKDLAETREERAIRTSNTLFLTITSVFSQ